MKTEKDPSLLFVYGTLMRGGKNEQFLNEPARARFIGTGKVKGLLYDVGEFPAYVPVPNPDTTSALQVCGEVYFLDDPETVLETIDIIEGYNELHTERSLYLRQTTVAEVGSSREQVWIYVFNQPTNSMTVIGSGDYRQFIAEQNKICLPADH